MKRLNLVLALLSLFSLPTYAENITKERIAQDPRLNAPVSLRAKRMPLAEVLHNLRKQTKVALEIEERDASSGIPIWMWCDKQHLHKVLNVLWSLTSHKEAEWTWIRRGEAGSYRYVLFQPQSAKDRGALLRSIVQKVFENYLNTMEQLSQMSPEERNNNQKTLMRAMLDDTGEWSESLIKSEETWKAVRLFFETVPRPLQSAVAHGESEWSVPLDKMPSNAKTLFEEMWAFYDIRRVQNGVTERVPMPKSIRFYASAGATGFDALIPYVIMYMGDAGGMSVLGHYGLEYGIQQMVRKGWVLKNESETSRQANQIVEASDKEKPVARLVGTPGKMREVLQNPQEFRIGQVADGANLFVVATLPRKVFSDKGSPVGKSVQRFVDTVRDTASTLLFKWRDESLLINDTFWFISEDGAIRYRLIKRLLTPNTKTLSLKELGELFGELSDIQILMLFHNYPSLRPLRELKLLLQLSKRYPEMLTPNGISLDAAQIKYLLRFSPFSSEPTLLRGTARALRLSSIRDGSNLFVWAEVDEGGRTWKEIGARTPIQALEPAP
jgi:uncharacterized protein YlxP (DUF503 family)